MPAQGHGNTKLEIAWTIAPAVILAVVAVPTVSTLWKVLNVPDHSNPLEVEVIGRQWWWEVNYPSLGVKTANEIWMPEDRVVHLKLTSKDVLHSFWIPKLGGKTDMIPNHPNEMWLQGDEPGLYYGQCAEFCGEAHALMRFRAVVATQADFDKWVANEKSNAMASTTDIAKRGEAIFMGNTALCWTCHTVTGTKAQGTTGPNLTHVGIRNSIAGGILDNNEQNLAAWLRDPYGVKPGNLMGKVITKGKLSETDIAALVAYLQGLK
jgi:cytochrome c oxidase subunit 2